MNVYVAEAPAVLLYFTVSSEYESLLPVDQPLEYEIEDDVCCLTEMRTPEAAAHAPTLPA